MSSNSIDTSISIAWRHQRENEGSTAVTEFEKILKQDNNNIDALYGMGLALRDTGKKSEATAKFQQALSLVDAATEARRPTTEAAEEHRKANTPEDDRLMMLGRMIKQRLSELQSGK